MNIYLFILRWDLAMQPRLALNLQSSSSVSFILGLQADTIMAS